MDLRLRCVVARGRWHEIPIFVMLRRGCLSLLLAALCLASGNPANAGAVDSPSAVTVTLPAGDEQTTHYVYDAADNLVSVSASGKATRFTYDAANQRATRTKPNGQITTYRYDLNGRLVGWLTRQSTDPFAAIFEQGDYTLNAAGQRTQLVYRGPDGRTRTTAWRYDDAGRLTDESSSQPVYDVHWELDAVGNRVSETRDGATDTYTYDATDRLMAITGAHPATFTWDTNGQLASRTDGSGASAQTTTYAFDARHQLVGAMLPNGVAISYRYQPDGNVASRTRTGADGSSATVHYFVDTTQPFAQVIAEYDDAGKPLAYNFFGAGELLMRTRAGQATYYDHDGLGSVHSVSDERGNAIATYAYDAWGNVVGTTGIDDSPYGFAGERYDSDLGLLYLRARWYDPKVGRFISADPSQGRADKPKALNGYLYANGSPQEFVDRSGRQADLVELDVELNVVSIGTTAEIATFNTGLIAANDAIWATTTSGGIGAAVSTAAGALLVASFADYAYRTKRDRFIGVPIIVFGNDLTEHANHILDAQTGAGSNAPSLSPFGLNRVPRPKGAWYNATRQCNPKARSAYAESRACDEYPFFSAYQGGPMKYREGVVSLRLLSLSESDVTRNFIGSFYRTAGISKDGVSPSSRVIALGIPWLPSFFTDRSGKVHPR